MTPFNILIICTLLMIVKSNTAYGHVPVFEKRDIKVEQPLTLKRPYDKSIAVYGFFHSDDDVDVFEFNIEEGDLIDNEINILIGSLVPACESLRPLLTSVALVGPKQESLQITEDRFFEEHHIIEEGQGAFILRNTEQAAIWYEPYTKHYYFRQKRATLRLTKTGKYRVFIWSDVKMKGDYVFEFGDKEIWKIGDILYTLWVYPKLLLEAELSTPDCRTLDLDQNKTERN